MRLVHDAKFISANTSLFCHFWRRPLFLFTRNIFSANMTELITIKVLNFFDFFWKEFLILNSQTDKLLKFYKYSLRHVNQDQCLFSNVYVTSNCVDLITKQKINNWLFYSAMQHEHCNSHRYCEAERERCILICAIYNCVRCCMAEDTVRTEGSVNTDSFTTTHCIHGVNPTALSTSNNDYENRLSLI